MSLLSAWSISLDSTFNFVTKIPNFRSSKGPNKKCFLIIELQMRKLFHWHYVFTQIWYLEQESKWALPKSFASCDEIMRRDEIRWFDGILYCTGILNFESCEVINSHRSSRSIRGMSRSVSTRSLHFIASLLFHCLGRAGTHMSPVAGPEASDVHTIFDLTRQAVPFFADTDTKKVFPQILIWPNR